jgi:hypothetical protein
MAYWFPTYDEYYRGYGLTRCKDGSCTAISNTPELNDKTDYPNIGLGWPVDKGRSYNVEEMKQRIDEVIAERERRIGWVKEFAKTQPKPDRTERYLLSDSDPYNEDGHRGRSYHTVGELYHSWQSGVEYYRRYCMGYIKISKTLFLYRQFLIEKGYIIDNE